MRKPVTSRWIAIAMTMVCLSCGRGEVFASTWARTYGGASNDSAFFVVPTADGGYLTIGESTSFGLGRADAWCVKLDASGTIVWQKAYGGPGDDHLYSGLQIPDGGYLLVGETERPGETDHRSVPVCLKLDASGSLLWQKTYQDTPRTQGGAYVILPRASRGYAVLGWRYEPGDLARSDAWLLELDSDGNLIEQRTLGDDIGRLSDMRLTSDGGCIFVGDIPTVASGDDGLIIKLGAAGNIEWQKTIGGLGQDRSSSVLETPSGAYLVTGDTRSFGAGQMDGWCVKLDGSGNVVWERAFGWVGDDSIWSLCAAADGGYVFTGSTTSFGVGNGDMWCVRLDDAGNVVWAKTYGGPGTDTGYDVIQSGDGSLVVAGRTISYGGGGYDAWCLSIRPNGFLDDPCPLGWDISPTVTDTTAVASPASAILGNASGVPQEAGGTLLVTSCAIAAVCGGPTVSGIGSTTGKPGAKAWIWGAGFGGDKRLISVEFGSYRAPVLGVRRGSMIRTVIPRRLKSRTSVEVRVVVNGVACDPFTFRTE